MNGNDEQQQVVFFIDEQLWTEAKIQAIKEKILLRDFVARAIKNELQKIESKQIV